MFKNESLSISNVELQKRVKSIMDEYDNNIEERRTKLKTLLGHDERKYLEEVVKKNVAYNENVFRQKQLRVEELRAKRENERLELVKEKRFQQQLNKYSFEVIPTIVNRRLRETKEYQKLQMVDNANKKQVEKELDHFWYELLIKGLNMSEERHEQDVLNQRLAVRHCLQMLEKQVQEHQVKKQHRQREIKEEAIRLDILREDIRREEIAALDEKRRKRDELYRDLINQTKERQEKLARDKLEENQYSQLMKNLQNLEMERERPLDQRARIRRETEEYFDYINRLEQERLNEEKQMNDLISAELREICRKQDVARANMEKAREALTKQCLQERDIQIQLKRQKYEEELTMQKAENQFLRMAREHNERVRAEYNRQKVLDAKKYESELKEQMKYNIIKQEREKADIDRLLKLGEAREAEYQQKIKEFLSQPLLFGEDSCSEYLFSKAHPFKQVVNQEKCPCPKPIHP